MYITIKLIYYNIGNYLITNEYIIIGKRIRK